MVLPWPSHYSWTSPPGGKGWACGLAEQLSHLFDIQRCPTFCSGHLHLPLSYSYVPDSDSWAVSLALSLVFQSQTLGRTVAVLCIQGLWPWKRFCEAIPSPWTMGDKQQEKQDLDSCLLEKIWSYISDLPRPFLWYQQPGSQGMEQVPLSTSLYQQLTAVTPTWTSTASSQHSGAGFGFPMCILPTRSLSPAVCINSPCQGVDAAWPSICLIPTGLPVRPAKGGQAMKTGSDSSTGRRLGSAGGQLRNLSCAMTGIKDWNTQVVWFEVSSLHSSDPDPHLIPSHVRAHPLLANLMFIFSPLVPCSRLLSCRSSSPESSVCMLRTQVKHTFLCSFPSALRGLEGTSWGRTGKLLLQPSRASWLPAMSLLLEGTEKSFLLCFASS